MTVTVSQLQQFDPSGFAAVANSWNQAVEALSSVQSGVVSAKGQMSSWTGSAAASANASLAGLAGSVGPAMTVMANAPESITGFLNAVSQAQSNLQGAHSAAVGAGCTMADDGTVTPPPAPAPPAGLQLSGTSAAMTGAGQAQQAKLAGEYQTATSAHEQLVSSAKGWQTTIKAALSAATAADKGCSSTVQGTVGLAATFGTSVGHGPGAVSARQTLANDVASWIGQDGGYLTSTYAGLGIGATKLRFSDAVEALNDADKAMQEAKDAGDLPGVTAAGLAKLFSQQQVLRQWEASGKAWPGAKNLDSRASDDLKLPDGADDGDGALDGLDAVGERLPIVGGVLALASGGLQTAGGMSPVKAFGGQAVGFGASLVATEGTIMLVSAAGGPAGLAVGLGVVAAVGVGYVATNLIQHGFSGLASGVKGDVHDVTHDATEVGHAAKHVWHDLGL